MVQEEITLEALEAQPKDTYLLVDIRDEAAFQFGQFTFRQMNCQNGTQNCRKTDYW